MVILVHPSGLAILLMITPPSLEEVCTAVEQLRNNRAPGENGVLTVVYKACLDFLGPLAAPGDYQIVVV